jgi:hypothetical protein
MTPIADRPDRYRPRRRSLTRRCCYGRAVPGASATGTVRGGATRPGFTFRRQPGRPYQRRRCRHDHVGSAPRSRRADRRVPDPLYRRSDAHVGQQRVHLARAARGAVEKQRFRSAPKPRPATGEAARLQMSSFTLFTYLWITFCTIHNSLIYIGYTRTSNIHRLHMQKKLRRHERASGVVKFGVICAPSRGSGTEFGRQSQRAKLQAGNRPRWHLPKRKSATSCGKHGWPIAQRRSARRDALFPSSDGPNVHVRTPHRQDLQ